MHFNLYTLVSVNFFVERIFPVIYPCAHNYVSTARMRSQPPEKEISNRTTFHGVKYQKMRATTSYEKAPVRSWHAYPSAPYEAQRTG
jgi:hypothetical protein